MNNIGSRMQKLRKDNNMSQASLANKINISKAQIIRYETKGTQPPADILRKIADIFNVSVDFLVYGNTEEKAKQSIKDNELLSQFKAVEELDSKDKATIKDIIDAFIKRNKIKNIAAL